MGARENRVETYLREEIEKLGGISRKWVSPGHAGVPDQICKVPGLDAWLVEVKTTDGPLEPHQVREHQRLRDAGFNVRTVYGRSGIITLINLLKWKLIQ